MNMQPVLRGLKIPKVTPAEKETSQPHWDHTRRREAPFSPRIFSLSQVPVDLQLLLLALSVTSDTSGHVHPGREKQFKQKPKIVHQSVKIHLT